MKLFLALIGVFLLFGGSKTLVASDAPRRSFREIWGSLSYDKDFKPIDRWESEGRPSTNNSSCDRRRSYSWS